MEHLWPTLIGVLIGNRTPWLFDGAVRLMRGQALREERAVNAEIQRLMAEIAQHKARIADLEELVDLLRKALDKHLMRESAVATAAQFIIAIVKMVADPTPEMLRLRDQAEQLLCDARAHLRGINNERRG